MSNKRKNDFFGLWRWEVTLNYSQYIVSDTNKHFKFDSGRKLNPWLKIWTKFLDMVTDCKIEKTTVYLLFFLFIQFSAIEIRSVFSHAKLMISWLHWLEKKLGCPCSLMSRLLPVKKSSQKTAAEEPFFNWQSSISRQIRRFQYARARVCANDVINYAQ